jgi:hypothetical protein
VGSGWPVFETCAHPLIGPATKKCDLHVD